MTSIRRLSLLEGAARATGPTAVIDVFRAFSSAAFALASGLERLVLADGLDEARELAGRLDALLMGEDEGRRPPDFDLGNSPAEVLRADLTGATVVQRTSAGTRAVRAAGAAGATPLYAASLLVAGATVGALAGLPEVTLVAAGRYGVEPAEEDEACADFLEVGLTGGTPDRAAVLERAFGGAQGRRHRDPEVTWVDPADLGLCLAVDLFDFAMQVVEEDGLVVLRAVPVP